MIRYISEDLLTEVRYEDPHILWNKSYDQIFVDLQLWASSDNIYQAILKSVIQILQKTSDDPHILWT